MNSFNPRMLDDMVSAVNDHSGEWVKRIENTKVASKPESEISPNTITSFLFFRLFLKLSNKTMATFESVRLIQFTSLSVSYCFIAEKIIPDSWIC